MPLSAEISQPRIADLLRQAVARRSVPQSVIFAGPEGSGKRAMALALAQAVNCPNQTDGDACGTCSTCKRIASGDHYDVVTVTLEDTASIGIDRIRRGVMDVVGYRPFEAQRRVFIIDPADALTMEAQSSLLKTLEEPPPAAMLLLISAYPDTLLPTVQSRCRRLRFERRDTGVVVDREDDMQAAIAFLLASLERSVPKRLKASAAMATVKGDRRVRETLATRLEIASSLLRDVSALVADEITAVKHRDAGADLRRLAQAFDQDRVVSAWGVLQRAQQSLDRNASAKIVADWAVMSL
jgi:DNA polymerase III delta' subunit